MRLHQVSVHTENARVRPTQGAILGFETSIGELHLHILIDKYQRGWAPLAAVPTSPHNRTIMENNGIIIPEIFQKWLLPPLQLMRESFSAGGCFVRRGKGSEYSPPKNIVDLADWPSYSPFINGYIPAKMLAAEGVSDISSEPDRTEWNLRLWQSGSGARKATPAEMHYQVVPEIIFSLELFDLFIARMISSLGNDNLPIEAIDSTIR